MHVSAPGLGPQPAWLAWGGDVRPAASWPRPPRSQLAPLCSGPAPFGGSLEWTSPFRRACLTTRKRRKGQNPHKPRNYSDVPHTAACLVPATGCLGRGVVGQALGKCLWSSPQASGPGGAGYQEPGEKVSSGPAAPGEQEHDGATASGRDMTCDSGDNEGSGHV